MEQENRFAGKGLTARQREADREQETSELSVGKSWGKEMNGRN